MNLKVLNNGCELLRPIGSGGFGTVWLARSLADGAFVAVKEIKNVSSNSHEVRAVKLFKNKIESLNHPNILRILEFSIENGSLYYSMPLCDGAEDGVGPQDPSWRPKTLATVMKARESAPRWFSAQEVGEIFMPIGRAVAALSQNGIIHRDIKPANIFFLNGAPVLGDVGLLTGDTPSASSAGTPQYNIPPKWYSRGNPDMWGLAAALFMLISNNEPIDMGRPEYYFPPQGKSSMTAADIKAWEAFRSVIGSATSHSPSARYMRISDMVGDVGRAVKGDFNSNEIKAAPPQKNPRRARHIALSALAAALCAGLALFYGLRAPSGGVKSGAKKYVVDILNYNQYYYRHLKPLPDGSMPNPSEITLFLAPDYHGEEVRETLSILSGKPPVPETPDDAKIAMFSRQSSRDMASSKKAYLLYSTNLRDKANIIINPKLEDRAEYANAFKILMKELRYRFFIDDSVEELEAYKRVLFLVKIASISNSALKSIFIVQDYYKESGDAKNLEWVNKLIDYIYKWKGFGNLSDIIKNPENYSSEELKRRLLYIPIERRPDIEKIIKEKQKKEAEKILNGGGAKSAQESQSASADTSGGEAVEPKAAPEEQVYLADVKEIPIAPSAKTDSNPPQNQKSAPAQNASAEPSKSAPAKPAAQQESAGGKLPVVRISGDALLLMGGWVCPKAKCRDSYCSGNLWGDYSEWKLKNQPFAVYSGIYDDEIYNAAFNLYKRVFENIAGSNKIFGKMEPQTRGEKRLAEYVKNLNPDKDKLEDFKKLLEGDKELSEAYMQRKLFRFTFNLRKSLDFYSLPHPRGRRNVMYFYEEHADSFKYFAECFRVYIAVLQRAFFIDPNLPEAEIAKRVLFFKRILEEKNYYAVIDLQYGFELLGNKQNIEWFGKVAEYYLKQLGYLNFYKFINRLADNPDAIASGAPLWATHYDETKDLKYQQKVIVDYLWNFADAVPISKLQKYVEATKAREEKKPEESSWAALKAGRRPQLGRETWPSDWKNIE